MTIDFSDERTARIALAHATPPGDRLTRRLIEDFGSAETVLFARTDTQPPGMTSLGFDSWRIHTEQHLSSREIEGVLAETEALGLTVLTPDDPIWAASRLPDLHSYAPLALWTRGDTKLLTTPLERRVTITGARAASPLGIEITGMVATDLSRSGHAIVSGAAYGIDAAAHRAALFTGGQTIAVMAGGLKHTYPIGHLDLAEQIAQHGLMLSEASPSRVPTKHRYEQRARLLVALSAATFIPQAGARSGALLLADHTESLHRGLGTVAAPEGLPSFDGCRILLEERGAAIVNTAGGVRDLIASVPSPPARGSSGRSSAHSNPLPRLDRLGRTPPDDPAPGLTR